MSKDTQIKKILIADDDPFIARMYQTKLSSAGFDVKVAVNGREATEIIKADKPSLMMLDLDMPEMTGFQALNALRDDGVDISDMPVVILTNSSKAEDRERAKSYGAEYMVKSDITPRQVLDHVLALLKVAPVAV